MGGVGRRVFSYRAGLARHGGVFAVGYDAGPVVAMSSRIEREIWEEDMRIRQARREKMHAAMEDYDRDVYLPAIKSLQARCASETGHSSNGRWHDNGLGRSWLRCNLCGATINEKYDS